MGGRDIIVIGGSAGAVFALFELLKPLRADIGAAVLVVVHIGASSRSRLPDMISSRANLPASWAENGEEIQMGRVYVAPPDQHLLLQDGHLLVVRGPKENHTRPAIDPLFRSAALLYGPRVVGVVLSGYLDDGTAGLLAIKDRGGIAIVQDPTDAAVASMPASARTIVPVDHCTPAREIGALLMRYDPPRESVLAPTSLQLEVEHRLTATEVRGPERELGRVSVPSPYTCPECGSVLYQLNDTRLLRFRCSQAHAWSAQSLLHVLTNKREEVLSQATGIAVQEAALSRQILDVHPNLPDGATLAQRSSEASMLARRLQTVSMGVESEMARS